MRAFFVTLIGQSLNLLSHFSPSKAGNIAIKLFSSPQKGRLTDAQIPIIQSAYYEDLEFENYTIATYRWIGDNKVVLLAHGWESNTTRWHDLIKLLKEQRHTVISLDAPAHGQSGSTEFNAILYAKFINHVAQKYKPEVIVGHSVGGMATVFSLFQNRLESLRKIILLGAPAHFSGVFQRYTQLMGYNSKISNTISDQIFEKYGHYPDYFSTADFAKVLDYKTLILHDKDDAVIPYEDALILHSSFKNSELIPTENEGHSLKSSKVNKAILHFINS